MTDSLQHFAISCPTPSKDSDLEERIIAHEGMRRYTYKDTLGIETIGIGRNISQKGGRGLSTDEIFYLFRNDLKLAEDSVSQNDWFKDLNQVRQGVVIEMIFNMGINRFNTFKNLIAALKSKNFILAVDEMKHSKWATQIGKNRLNDMCNRMLTGKYS